jgi:elongation of very long chain fatty acids protein 6
MSSAGYSIPLLAIFLYLVLCYFGPIWMKNRQAFRITHVFACWNFFLAVFSFYGMIRTLPHVSYRFLTLPFEQMICESIYTSFGGGAVGLVSLLFVFSKIIELFDTIFLILRKKELLFLHCYHHITVLLFCWNSMITKSSIGIYFSTMNYTVHTIMYSYFGFQTIGWINSWTFPTWIITMIQVHQMILGCFLMTMIAYYKAYGGIYYKPGECHTTVDNIIFGMMIYSTYLVFFLDFALEKFFLFRKNVTRDYSVALPSTLTNEDGSQLKFD